KALNPGKQAEPDTLAARELDESRVQALGVMKPACPAEDSKQFLRAVAGVQDSDHQPSCRINAVRISAKKFGHAMLLSVCSPANHWVKRICSKVDSKPEPSGEQHMMPASTEARNGS